MAKPLTTALCMCSFVGALTTGVLPAQAFDPDYYEDNSAHAGTTSFQDSAGSPSDSTVEEQVVSTFKSATLRLVEIMIKEAAASGLLPSEKEKEAFSRVSILKAQPSRIRIENFKVSDRRTQEEHRLFTVTFTAQVPGPDDPAPTKAVSLEATFSKNFNKWQLDSLKDLTDPKVDFVKLAQGDNQVEQALSEELRSGMAQASEQFDQIALLDLRNAATNQEANFVDSERYLSCTGSTCESSLPSLKLSPGVTLEMRASADGQSYTATAYHVKGTGKQYNWDSNIGRVPDSQAPQSKGSGEANQLSLMGHSGIVTRKFSVVSDSLNDDRMDVPGGSLSQGGLSDRSASAPSDQSGW